MDIFKLLNNDLSEMNEREQEYAKAFTGKLKKKIIDELVQVESEELISKLNNNKEDFEDSIRQILVNGVKGYRNMSIQLLVTIYLEKKNDEDFINLIEAIN